MHTNHPNPLPIGEEINLNRTARLQRGQRHWPCPKDIDPAAHQQGISMPADAKRTLRYRGDLPVMFFQHLPRQSSRPLPDTAVHLLQRDDVRPNLLQDRQNAFGITPPIQSDGLANVIAGKGQFHGEQVGAPRPGFNAPWWR